MEEKLKIAERYQYALTTITIVKYYCHFHSNVRFKLKTIK